MSRAGPLSEPSATNRTRVPVRAVVFHRPAPVHRHRPLDDVGAEHAAGLELGELDDLVPLAQPDLGPLLEAVALARRALGQRLHRDLRIVCHAARFAGSVM